MTTNSSSSAANPASSATTPAAGGKQTAALVDLPGLPPIACPCGQARRAFADHPAFPGTLHLTEISTDARPHHHREHTEIYVVLECEAGAEIELDGIRHPVQPLKAILIPPGVQHRAVGRMQVLIVCTPEFDPADEHLA